MSKNEKPWTGMKPMRALLLPTTTMAQLTNFSNLLAESGAFLESGTDETTGRFYVIFDAAKLAPGTVEKMGRVQ